MSPASRNLWLELAAIALLLISLLLLPAAGYSLTMFIVHDLLPNEPPREPDGKIIGFREFLAGALTTVVPAAGLIATAWGLRSLLVDETEPGA